MLHLKIEVNLRLTQGEGGKSHIEMPMDISEEVPRQLDKASGHSGGQVRDQKNDLQTIGMGGSSLINGCDIQGK